MGWLASSHVAGRESDPVALTRLLSPLPGPPVWLACLLTQLLWWLGEVASPPCLGVEEGGTRVLPAQGLTGGTAVNP